jgi:hypothetical protein
MKRLILAALAATALSTAAIAGPCDVSGAIPNCEAILSGKMAPAPYEDKSKLDFGPSNPVTMETPAPVPGVTRADLDRMQQILLDNDVARAQYGVRVARRQLDAAIKDYWNIK